MPFPIVGGLVSRQRLRKYKSWKVEWNDYEYQIHCSFAYRFLFFDYVLHYLSGWRLKREILKYVNIRPISFFLFFKAKCFVKRIIFFVIKKNLKNFVIPKRDWPLKFCLIAQKGYCLRWIRFWLSSRFLLFFFIIKEQFARVRISLRRWIKNMIWIKICRKKHFLRHF